MRWVVAHHCVTRNWHCFLAPTSESRCIAKNTLPASPTLINGLAVGRHGLVGKQNMYDHSVRVPFIIVGPNARAGVTISDPIYLQDVVPTTIELAGISMPSHIQFKSLIPKLTEQRSEPQHLPIIGAYLNKQRMIFDGQYKLIVYPEVPTLRLYDLEEDPSEMTDLSKDPDSAETIQTLLQKQVHRQTENNDPLALRDVFPIQSSN